MIAGLTFPGGIPARAESATVPFGSHPLSILDPAGPAAADSLWLLLLTTSIAVVVLCVILIATLMAFRRHQPGTLLSAPLLFAGLGTLLPALLLAGLLAAAFVMGARWLGWIDQPRQILIVADLKGWSAQHDDAGTPRVMRDRLVLPAGERIELLVASADVIHSFWVPRLGGKVDAIPGRVNRLLLETAEPGRFRGQCAEYCGVNHAHMHFLVEVVPSDQLSGLLQQYGEEVDADPGVFVPRAPSASDRLLQSARGLGARLAP